MGARWKVTRPNADTDTGAGARVVVEVDADAYEGGRDKSKNE